MIEYRILTENSGKWYSILNQPPDIAVKWVAFHLHRKKFPGSNVQRLTILTEAFCNVSAQKCCYNTSNYATITTTSDFSLTFYLL